MSSFKMHEIRELIRLIDESTIEEFEIDNEGAKIHIKKGLSKVAHKKESVNFVEEINDNSINYQIPQIETNEPEVKKPVQEKNLHKITSPMVGTFYHAASPDNPPYVKVGDKVGNATVVCIVEAMKLMNELEAEVEGTVEEILVENGQLVEYGQPLFLIKKL